MALGLIEMLKNAGHTVVGHARNGIEAVKLVDTVDPELVFVAIRMPDLDGLKAARRILRPMPSGCCKNRVRSAT